MIQAEGIEEMKKISTEKLEDGLFHCTGRIGESELQPEAIKPIFIPNKNIATELLIMKEHEALGHSGVASTLSQLRQKYWFPQGRAKVKNVIASKCMKCRRWNSKPFKLPQMPNFPSERVKRSKPFQNVGLDYAGPFVIRRREEEKIKMWICCFTCLATRAIHLETAENLSAETFLNCLRKFCARRGVPETITCDNAGNFKLTAEV